MHTEALKLALDAPERHTCNGLPCVEQTAVEAIRAALAAPAAVPQPFLFIAMDDDKRAHLTWCADEAAVRAAVQGAMFWLPDGEELSADHAEQLDANVEELLDSGAVTFEGDPPLYLYRVAGAALAAPSVPPADPL